MKGRDRDQSLPLNYSCQEVIALTNVWKNLNFSTPRLLGSFCSLEAGSSFLLESSNHIEPSTRS